MHHNISKEHFEFVHQNVYADDMNEGKLEYVKFGKVTPNNHVSLSHGSIFAKGSSMGLFLNEEARACYSPWHFISHMQ